MTGEILVKFKHHALQFQEKEADALLTRQIQILSGMDLDVIRYYPRNGVYRVRVRGPLSFEASLKALAALNEVTFAEPNYIRYPKERIPNDPLFIEQWALENIQIPAAWDVETGSRDIIIAFADSGIDYIHEDLKGNLWRNPGEVCDNGIDDDSDGYVDNCFGVDVITGVGNPFDENGHGTHVSGIAGAVGNNLRGISGVNWGVSIMALKFLGSDGSGDVASEIEAIEFAMGTGARVVNMAFGADSYSNLEKEAIENAENILFVAAAGNERFDNDVHPLYPASYDLPNIISVAASDQSDSLLYFSNYGKSSVDVAAPGINVLGTLPGNDYGSFTGTSMSAALVTGLAGLILAKNPALTVSQLKDRILRTVDTSPSLGDKTLTGGRINAYRALTEAVSGPYIFKIIPEKGPVGSIVTIRGSNFKNSAGSALFGESVPAEIVSWSNQKIIAKVPEGAVTGPVRVLTSEGLSNQVHFEVTPYPTGIRLSFPVVKAHESHVSFLVISNPVDEPVKVYIRIMDTIAGESTIKIITLNPFQKKFWELKNSSSTGWESLMVDCESEGFFGAAVLSFRKDLSEMMAMPPIVGRQLSLIEVPPR